MLQKRFDQVREVRGARETLRLHLDPIEIRAEADDVLAAQLAKAVDVAHNVLHRGLFRLRKEMRIEVHADKAVFLNDRLGLRLIKIARRVAQLAATGMTGNRREHHVLHNVPEARFVQMRRGGIDAQPIHFREQLQTKRLQAAFRAELRRMADFVFVVPRQCDHANAAQPVKLLQPLELPLQRFAALDGKNAGGRGGERVGQVAGEHRDGKRFGRLDHFERVLIRRSGRPLSAGKQSKGLQAHAAFFQVFGRSHGLRGRDALKRNRIQRVGMCIRDFHKKLPFREVFPSFPQNIQRFPAKILLAPAKYHKKPNVFHTFTYILFTDVCFGAIIIPVPVMNGMRGISAVGSAQHWQCWGQEFESPMLHGRSGL